MNKDRVKVGNRIMRKPLTEKDYFILTICKSAKSFSVEIGHLLGIADSHAWFRINKLSQMGYIKSSKTRGEGSGSPKFYQTTNKINNDELKRFYKNKIKECQIYLNFLESGGYAQIKNKIRRKECVFAVTSEKEKKDE